MLPSTIASFGCKNLSIIQPQIGAVVAYSPPWIMKTAPSITGVKSNCLKCGSSVAAKNPIDALVATILIEHTITPGILNSDSIETEMYVWRNKISNGIWLIVQVNIDTEIRICTVEITHHPNVPARWDHYALVECKMWPWRSQAAMYPT